MPADPVVDVWSEGRRYERTTGRDPIHVQVYVWMMRDDVRYVHVVFGRVTVTEIASEREVFERWSDTLTGRWDDRTSRARTAIRIIDGLHAVALEEVDR